MMILSKEKDVMVNLDNVDAIGFKTNQEGKKTIVAHLVSGGSTELGTYPTEERARDVFDTIFNSIGYSLFEMPQDIE